MPLSGHVPRYVQASCRLACQHFGLCLIKSHGSKHRTEATHIRDIAGQDSEDYPLVLTILHQWMIVVSRSCTIPLIQKLKLLVIKTGGRQQTSMRFLSMLLAFERPLLGTREWTSWGKHNRERYVGFEGLYFDYNIQVFGVRLSRLLQLKVSFTNSSNEIYTEKTNATKIAQDGNFVNMKSYLLELGYRLDFPELLSILGSLLYNLYYLVRLAQHDHMTSTARFDLTACHPSHLLLQSER